VPSLALLGVKALSFELIQSHNQADYEDKPTIHLGSGK